MAYDVSTLEGRDDLGSKIDNEGGVAEAFSNYFGPNDVTGDAALVAAIAAYQAAYKCLEAELDRIDAVL